MTDRGWAAAGIFAALVAVIWSVGWWAGVFTRPLWLPRWRCVEGFWHWRKECDGHDAGERGDLVLADRWEQGPHDDNGAGRWGGPDERGSQGNRGSIGDLGRGRAEMAVNSSGDGIPAGDRAVPAALDAEDALDEAWVAELHHINADLHTPASDVLGLTREPWIVRTMAEQWDWHMAGDADYQAALRRHAAEQDKWRRERVGERKAYRLGCGLEWRDDMGLAA